MIEHHESITLNILVIDDEANIRKTLRVCLDGLGHTVTTVSNGKDALSEIAQHAFDLAFLDLRLGTESGLDLIPAILGASPRIMIIVMTAYASIETAVEAIRRGATDYIAKPFTPDHVRIVTERASSVRTMEQRITTLQEDIEQLHPAASFTSRYPEMQRAIELARQVASSEAVVLLRGPSGTGKTVLARAIHDWSYRAEKPFGTVSCPTLGPDILESELFGHIKGAFTGALRDNMGRVAASDGGSLLLDEIGDLPLVLQPKLLRFIQDREYERVGDHQTRRADVRIIAATNTDLEQAVKEGHFREDLFYRLNVIQIDIPPLSSRPDDIAALATDMLSFFGSQNHKVVTRFGDDAMSALKRHSWPGNIRELRNVIERAVIVCQSDRIETIHLPESFSPQDPPAAIGNHIPLKQIEKEHIRRVIASTKTLQEAADILGIDQATLWYKRKLYGL